MRKFTTYEFTFGKRKSLPLVASLVLLPFLGMGQSVDEIKQIRKESNLRELNKIERSFKKNELSVNQLKTLAKKRRIEFSGEIDNKRYQLVGFDEWTNEPLYYITHNVGASVGTGANKLNSTGGVFSLDGEGMIVHEWDGGGVLVSHQEFGGRALQKDAANSTSDHSTHVAGTMIASGVDNRAKGMAPKATLHAYEWTNDKTEMVEAAKNGALVSNHSYGFISGFTYGQWSGEKGWHWLGADEDTEFKGYGKYTASDRELDIISLNAPFYLQVKSAGNDRGGGPKPGERHFVRINGSWKSSTKVRQLNGGEDGFDVIYAGALGKNILTVGAAQKVGTGYKQASDVKMASFSSYGPVDDGRIKPDISGVGVGIYSTNSTGDKEYTTMSGTSMAAPNVTGSLLLLQEHYKKLYPASYMRAVTLKALAVATANEAGNSAGPDYGSGWGLLNAYEAAVAISTKDKYSLISEETLNNGATNAIEVKASGIEPLKVTIAWADPVGTNDMLPSSSLNDRTVTLINDLDVKVTKNGETYLPWKLDPVHPSNPATRGDNTVDNIEQVLIENPEAGATYRIEVSHKNTLKKNEFTEISGRLNVSLIEATEQNYSMIVTGINQDVNKDLSLNKIEVSVSPKDYTSNTPVKFYVQNKGLQVATGGKLVYELFNKDTNTVEKTGEVAIADLDASNIAEIIVNLDLSKSFVNYSIKGKIVFDGDEVTINNATEESAYGYLVDLTPNDSRYTFDFEKDLMANGWAKEDKNKDGKTWVKYDNESFAKSGIGFAVNFPNRVKGSDDWLFTPPIRLKANTKYRVVYNTRKFQDLDEKIAVYYGDDANSSVMLKKLGEEEILFDGNTDNGYYRYFYEFETPVEKVVYLGFNNKVDTDKASYAIAVDDVVVERSIGKPDVDFVANKFTPNTFDVVSLKGNVIAPSADLVTSYEWKFTPNTVTYKNGTNANSLDVDVLFQNVGKYTVEFKASNGAGSGVKNKVEYIDVKNVETKADFTASKKNIYEGEVVVFTNASTGSPKPTEFEWTITPSDGVELQGQNTDRNLVAKFTKPGKYSVKLKATSANNSDVFNQENFITVTGTHNPVNNLTQELDKDSHKLDLKWEKPNLLPVYYEGFSGEDIPADMKVYNNNNDDNSWKITPSSGNNGTEAVMSYSWYFGAFDVDDWLVTPKLKAGAETLKYMALLLYPERYDVYVIPATDSGTHPTVDEIKAKGKVVYTNELEPVSEKDSKNKVFKEISLDISNETSKEFYVAFHHRTKAEDNGFRVILDDIMVGYESSPYTVGKGLGNELKDDVQVARENQGEELVSMAKPSVLKANFTDDVKINFGVVDLPELTGYRVEKDDVSKASITGKENTTYSETLDAKGVYTYKVYAVYSDGESEPVSITVDASTLATSDVEAGNGLQVYPNPSNGMFVVKNERNVSSFTTEVYNMAGQVIYQNKFTGSQAELNLTKFSTGVYVLKVVDNSGNQKSVKLIIK